MPPLEALLGEDSLGPRRRIEIGQRLQPGDARESVALLPALLGVAEVVGERADVRLREAERTELALNVHASEF